MNVAVSPSPVSPISYLMIFSRSGQSAPGGQYGMPQILTPTEFVPQVQSAAPEGHSVGEASIAALSGRGQAAVPTCSSGQSDMETPSRSVGVSVAMKT